MTTVALTLVQEVDDPRMSLPFVPVEINGVELEALVDSGAGRTQVVDRPGLIVRDSATKDSVGAFGVPMQSIGRSVVSCRLAGIDAGAVEVDIVSSDLPRHFNVIGQDVLAQFRCMYRLADGVMTLDPEPPVHTHPIHLGTRHHIYLEATWKDVNTAASAVFDTGASVTVVNERFAALHHELFTPEGTQTGADVTGHSVQTQMAIMRAPCILGEQLTEALVAIVDLSAANRTLDRPMDLILGWTLLKQADWYIDHPGRRAACLPFGK
ncbi:MAG: hypothetical protein JWO11_2045 [Nocardioides sp.]|nr:hypothetical protein [Nocardioides sp.]